MKKLASNPSSYAIAKVVRDQGPLSRAEIARLLKISPSTVGRIVELLIHREVLEETGQGSLEGAGRPSVLLEFNAKIGTVLTVDLRLTDAYAAITDLSGNILSSKNSCLTVEDSRQSILELLDLVRSLLQNAPEISPVVAIVIGAPSLVDSDKGILEWAPSLGWKNIPLVQIMEDEFSLPTLIENDVNLAALGEFWKGAGKSISKNMVFVSVGTGIGAGVILNGELYRGATHAAGEVAYFVTDVNILRSDAMRMGNLENRVGRKGLIRMAQLVAQRYPASKLADLIYREQSKIHARDIFQLAEEGDQAARVVFNEFVDIITIVICNISVLLDPEMIILGGPSDWKWQSLITEIQASIGSSLLRPINLMPSKLGKDSLILGGAYSALELLHVFQLNMNEDRIKVS